jgi:hypothetical protein
VSNPTSPSAPPPPPEQPWGHTEKLPVVGYVHQPPGWDAAPPPPPPPPPGSPTSTQELPIQPAGGSDTAQFRRLSSTPAPSPTGQRIPTPWLVMGAAALVGVLLVGALIGLLVGRSGGGNSTPQATTSGSNPSPSLSTSLATATPSAASTSPGGQRAYPLDGPPVKVKQAEIDFAEKPKGFTSTRLLGQKALVNRKTSQIVMVRSQSFDEQSSGDRQDTTQALDGALSRLSSSALGESGTVMIPTRSGVPVEFAYRIYVSQDGNDRQLMAVRALDGHLMMVVYSTLRDSFDREQALQMVASTRVSLR